MVEFYKRCKKDNEIQLKNKMGLNNPKMKNIQPSPAINLINSKIYQETPTNNMLFVIVS